MTKATNAQKKPILRRMLAFLIVCIMLLGEFAMLPIPRSFAAADSGHTLLMNQYSSDLYIYNYLCYTSGTGSTETGSGNTFILKGASNVNVTVGDIVGAEGDARPIDNDIQLQLNALSFAAGKKITVNPIYNGKRTLAITVTAASSIDTLVIKSGAKVTLTLQDNLTVNAITLEEGASLEIRTGNKTLHAPSILGSGSLTISGGGTVNCTTISVGSLVLNNATLDGGSTGKITASGDITVGGATLQNLVLFGYDSDAEGNKTITFNGGHFSSVETVGAAEDTNATVAVKGIATVASSQNTNYIYDYSITYTAGDTELTPEADWPTAYRVKHDTLTGGTTAVLGYISSNTFTASTTVTLPTYDTDFFGYDGWELDGVKTIALSETQRGDIILDAILRAGTVTVDMILGYSPNETTNDLPLPLDHQTLATAVGEVIELSTPTRFGYVFKGWRVTSGSLHGVHFDSYTVAAADLDTIADSDAFSLTMEAIWEADRFPLRLMLGTVVDVSTLSISFDGENFVAFNTFVASLPDGVTYDDRTLSFSDYIAYEESLSDYFTRILGGYPVLRDRTNLYTFATWYNAGNGATLTGDDLYRYGGGILVRPSSDTLVSWQKKLKEAPIGLAPLWVETTHEYTMTVTNPSDWAITVNGTVTVPDANGEIKITLGSKVSLRAPVGSTYSITHWSLTNVSTVTERAYAAGDAFLYYDFDMPASDVTAVCRKKNDTTNGTQLLVNLAESPITFAQEVSYNSRKHTGFWFNVKSDSMTPLFRDDTKGYFYIWNFAEPFHVTTYGEETKNQLTLVSEMAGGVYLRSCNLVATDAYLTDAIGRRLDGKLLEAGKSGAPASLANDTDWSAYGNIVLDNRTNPQYTTNLYMRGTNTVASIMPSHFNGTSAYAGILNIIGERKTDSFLTLGSVVALGKLFIKNLTINEYNDNFEYLLYTVTAQMNCDNIDIADSIISAHTKRIYNSYNYLDVRGSDIDIGSIFVAYSLRLYNHSYVRVRGNVICFYYLIDVQGTSSLVVDGGIFTMSHTSSYGNGRVSSSGYVIVKGIGIVGTALNVTGNSTVVTNMLAASRGSTFSNGVIVTNLIGNPATRVPILSGDEYVIEPYTSSTASSADYYPFYTYSNRQQVISEYLFSGSSVYLFGYHKSSGRVYDVTSNLIDDAANPVKPIADSLLDESGDLLASLRSTPNPTAVASAAQASVANAITSGLYQNNDCVQIGDSKHTASSAYAKTVKVTGGTILACGNINFFNETTVTGGNILCGGRFGSKRSLTISGGRIAAREVGISSDCTETENGLLRYSKLTLSGGTIVTDRIGAHTVAASGNAPKGVLDLTVTATITPYLASSVTVASNLYANYLYDTAIYQVGAGNPTSLDFIGVYENGAITGLTLQSELTLISPTLKSASGTAMWLYDNAGGEKITSVSVNGLVNGDETLATYVYTDRLVFAVYAAKGSYTLAIKGDYENTGFDVSYNGNNYDANTSFSVNAGDTVTIRLDNVNIFDRTIVWYTDAAGIIHNALKSATSTVDRATRTITFRMPYSDTEIFITSEFTLHLNLYSISFTESGFALEEAHASRREDSLFDYAGHILITQSTNAVTYNRIFFETSNSGNAATGRRITLYQLNQSSLGSLYGTVIADGAAVEFTIKNSAGRLVRITGVEVPQNASVRFVGATANPAENTLSFYSFLSLGSYLCVGGTIAGTITYENLTLGAPSGYSQFARSTSTTRSPNTVTFRNCIYEAGRYYTYDLLAYRMDAVVIEGCTFRITGSSDLSSSLVESCKTLTITDSTIEYTYGGTRSGRHPFYAVENSVTIHNSTMDIRFNRASSSSATYLEIAGLQGNITVSGNSVVNIEQRIGFKSLILCDTASLIVESGEGYLFCPNITLRDSATLQAGYVFVAGFAVSDYVDKQAVIAAMQNGSVTNGASYDGLSVEGGTLDARYFVGGDKNAKISISGGTVITAALGTLGAYYGYGKYIPNLTESEFVYSYTIIPSGTTVAVSGGTVRITAGGYLGGMNATVTVTGGVIELLTNATLGITDQQTTTLLNDASSRGEPLSDAVSVSISGGEITGHVINTPYGDTAISSDAAVSVARLTAENGEITISSVSDKYTNRYSGTDGLHATVGVTVSETLQALTVTITDGAVVYAETAYAYAVGGTFGSLTVSQNAHLYTGAEYGSKGDGETEVVEDNGTIYGKIRYTIVYELNGDVIDKAVNDARNPADYLFSTELIQLYDPIRPGYDFAGWYMEPDFSGTPFTTLTAAAAKNQKIYAKWTPKKVRFLVEVTADVLDLTESKLSEESIGYGIDGTLSGKVFTFAKLAEIAYLDTILGIGEGHINLDDYALRSFTITELAVKGTENYINGASLVTKEFVNAGTVTLAVTMAVESRAELKLDLNLSGNLPIDAIFNNTTSPDSSTSTTISSYVDYGAAVGTANGFATLGSLVVPSAPGYLFAGWYTDKACSEEAIDASYIITPESPTTFYAKWVVKEYYFAFDAGENSELDELNKLTLDASKPDASSLQHKLVLRIAYDQPLSSGTLVWAAIDGSYTVWTESASLESLPYAWVQGFTHNGAWYFTDKDGNKKTVTLSTAFNLTSINSPDWQSNSTDTSGVTPTIAVVFSPVIERTFVTYDVNGGTLVGIDSSTAAWKDNYQSISENGDVYTMQTARYKQPLLGYTASVTASASYTLENTVVCPHSVTYGVISTTSEHFKTNGYHENDYRFEIGKKGYTFKGWRLMQIDEDGAWSPVTDTNGDDIFLGYLPQYENVALQAVWEANTYDITLKPYDAGKDYYSAFNVSTDVHIGLMTVGNEITGYDALWPSRASDWYAYASGTTPDENQKRYLLGFTFDPLDPGIADSTHTEGYAAYQKYASDVTTLLNNNAVLTHSAGSDTIGSIFSLPADSTYGDSVVNGTHFVPDYPSGSSVSLYAIYRERSLVFVEYYTDGEGETHKRIMSSFPWDQWSDYADPNAESGGAYITREDKPDDIGDYALIGWRFNASNITNTAYPATVRDAVGNYTVSPDDCRTLYATLLPGLKQEAEDLGTFDIMVYSVWAAYQEIESATLENDTDPLVDFSASVIDIAIPPSMQKGVLNHTIADIPNLTLVHGSALSRFDSALGNTTVAIKASLYNESGTLMEETYLEELTESDTAPKNLFTLEVEGNWRIVFRLYHSSVVSKSALHSFSMTLGFEDDSLAYQKISFNEINLFMSPTEYTVDYTATLPTDPTVTEWNGFDSATHRLTVENVGYGSPLCASVPNVTGYTANGIWASNEGSLSYGDALVMDTLAENAVMNDSITLSFTTAWTINRYLFSADDELLDRWSIYYGELRTPLLTDSELDFSTSIVFIPKASGAYPEFVRLITDSESSLDLVASYDATEGSYHLSMPAIDMTAFFNRLMTLYLENGSIAITEAGYTQNGDVTWHGDYAVYMNAANTATVATANTLQLSGDLSDRAITLGNLAISAKDAIALGDSTAVSLTNSGRIDATNILVPETASLTLTGGSLALAHTEDRAAIGGDSTNGANGVIALDSVTIALTLTQTYASGIGSGNASSGGEAITLTNCHITVKENATSDVFHGAWIGGVGVDTVTLQSTMLSLAAGSDEMLGPTVLEADEIVIESSALGSAGNPLIDPIHATNTITVTDSTLYQRLSQGVAIGTENGVIEIENSHLQCDVTTPSALYTGRLVLVDQYADVTIAGVQILETTHGDMTITDTGVTQGANTFTHNKHYLILHELSNSILSSLTVNSLTAGSNVTLKGADLAALTANTDTPLIIEGNVTVNETVTVANGKTLTVTATDTLTLTDGFDSTTSGHYVQNGGTLVGNNNLAIGGNLTLIGVTATASGTLGSTGTSGVTTVTLTDSTVIADRIGALGTQNTTFTFVQLTDTSYVGTLVQDHYRLDYVIDAGFTTSHLPTVLRSETTSGVITYTPAVPAAPTGGAGFLFWYLKKPDSSIIAIGSSYDPSLDRVAGLTAELWVYADNENADGTVTLQIFAFMNLSIEGIVESGKILREDDFSSMLQAVMLHASGKWTAKFTVSGSTVAGASYVLKLASPLAAGTKLTLGVMTATVPTFYYYTVVGNETEIALASFTRMGSLNEAPALLSAVTGSELFDILILSADFTDASDNEDIENTVTLAVVANGATVSEDSFDYKTEKADTVEVSDSTVTVMHYGDTQFGEKMLYLIVTVQSNSALPYEASLVLGTREAARLSDTVFAVVLDSSTSDFTETLTPTLVGFAGGNYSLGFELTLAERGSKNPLGQYLTDAAEVRVTIEEKERPVLDVLLHAVNGEETFSRILASGVEHRIDFTVEATVDYQITAGMKDEAGSMTETDYITFTEDEETNTVTAVLDESTPAGTYTVIFSIDDTTEEDDVTFTFLMID